MMVTNTMKTADRAMRASFMKCRTHFTMANKMSVSDTIFVCKEFTYEQFEFKFFSNN